MRGFVTASVFLGGALVAAPVVAQQAPPVEATNATPSSAPRADALAVSPEAAPEAQPAAPAPAPDRNADEFRWHSVAGGYRDPTSVFALHGYVNGVFASTSPDWTKPDSTRPGPPGQLLVPNTNVSSFQFDSGIVLSSQVSPRTAILVEVHAVTDPSGKGAAGPGGLTLAMTEATASWQVAKDLLRLSGGLYWVPFGTVNHDWMGAQNIFSLMPRASSAFPVHWNERGVRLDGAVGFSEGAAVNYVVSYGNGLEVPDITGQIGYDRDESKALAGRVGLFPGAGPALDVGFSFARMRWSEPGEPEAARPLDDPRHYGALMRSLGLDANLRLADATLRTYAIWSREDLSATAPQDPDPQDLHHLGFLVEGVYLLKLSRPVLSVGALAPKVRYDLAQLESLRGGGIQLARHEGYTVSFGLNVYPSSEIVESGTYPFRNFFLSLEYHLLRERTGPQLDNDRFVARITGRF